MRNHHPRRGAIVPLTALLLTLLLGMVAFVVDIGWIAVAKSDLQNAADAAALAGVNSMMDAFVSYHLPGQSESQKTWIQYAAQSTARAKAKQYAEFNAAGGVASLTLLDSDIEFGFTDQSNVYTPAPTYTGYPNTIKVTIRRDGKANGPLGLFFGGVMGVKHTSLSASAAATMQTGNITDVPHKNYSGGMLPITYDVNKWSDFLKSIASLDSLTLTDDAANPSVLVYPSLKAPGNFGQLSLNNTNVGESLEANWIIYGVSASDLQALRDANLIPLSSHPDQWDWLGETGFKSALVEAINAKIGQTYLLPLFKPKNADPLRYEAGDGSGSNYRYNIVQFVGVRIAPSTDINAKIFLSPAMVYDPTLTIDATSIVPAGTTTTLVTTFVPPRLTQ